MKTKRGMITVAQAQELVAARIRPCAIEKIDLLTSIGRRLADEVRATHDLPHFRRSGMDGFAVRFEDIRNASSDTPAVLDVLETIPCGSVPTCTVTAGTASRIMTGAALPDGADTVIMFEMTRDIERDGKTYVQIGQPVEQGKNVSPIGLELSAGAPVIEQGREIRAGELAMLATFGYATVPVYKRPTVAIFTTGSELLPVDASLQPGKIRDSNTPMLAALVMQAGGVPVMFDTVPDDREAAREKIKEAFAKADLLITTGGVSVGDYDILTEIFNEWEGETLFNKVAMRPGKHTTVGVWQDKMWCGLSGNPGACYVGFELFVRPILWGMQGKKEIYLPTFTAHFDDEYSRVNPYPRYMRGISSVENGQMIVRPLMDQASITTSIMDADCLIILPQGNKPIQRGDLVTALKLPVTLD